MKFFGVFRKSQSSKPSLDAQPVDNEPLEEQRKDLMRARLFRDGLAEIQDDCDVLPDAYSDFGTTLTNPIPVNGLIGELVYLNMLRWNGDTRFLYHRLQSIDSPVSKQKIDAYELVTTDGTMWTVLYFSMYHPRRSTKVPLGMTLTPWSKLESIVKSLVKYAVFGSNFFVEFFPYRLDEAIITNNHLRENFPDAVNLFAGRVELIVTENKGNWIRPESHKAILRSIRPEHVTSVNHYPSDGGPSKGQTVFGEDGRATMIVNENSDGTTAIFSLGSIIRRELDAEDLIIAGGWAGAGFEFGGQPVWDDIAEERFANAFVAYNLSRSKLSAWSKDDVAKAAQDALALPPELIELFERHVPPGNW